MVGWGEKVGDKYGSNGVGEGGAIQDSFSDSDSIWEKYVGGDGVHDKITRGISSLVIQKDSGYDGSSYNRRRFGMAPSG